MRFEAGKTTVSLNFSFVAAVVLMLLLCDSGTVFICVFSSLFHECGHLFMMLLLGENPRSVIFGAFGIRIERRAESILSYGKEVLIALGGVFGNLILMLSAAVFYFLSESQWSLQLLAVNGFIALFNLLPVKQLDMGRCLEYVVCQSENEEKSRRLSDTVSAVTLILLSAGCVSYNIFIGVNISFIAVTIYLILSEGVQK